MSNIVKIAFVGLLAFGGYQLYAKNAEKERIAANEAQLRNVVSKLNTSTPKEVAAEIVLDSAAIEGKSVKLQYTSNRYYELIFAGKSVTDVEELAVDLACGELKPAAESGYNVVAKFKYQTTKRLPSTSATPGAEVKQDWDHDVTVTPETCGVGKG